MKAIVCDRCKTVVSAPKSVKDTTLLIFSTENLGEYHGVHLCKICLKDFRVFLEMKGADDVKD